MKATLTFDLDNPGDRTAHLRCVNSLKMAIVLANLSNIHKSFHRDDNEVDPETIDKVFSKIFNSIEQQGLIVEELT